MAIDFQQTQPKAAFPKFTDYKAAFPKSPEALVKQNDSQAPLRIISPSSDSLLPGRFGKCWSGEMGVEVGGMTLSSEMVRAP